MSHAEKCPVCSGSGKIEDNPPTSTACNYKTCHGCKGAGWVPVPDNVEPYPPPFNPENPVWWTDAPVTTPDTCNDITIHGYPYVEATENNCTGVGIS